jgi:hypothetical protein
VDKSVQLYSSSGGEIQFNNLNAGDKVEMEVDGAGLYFSSEDVIFSNTFLTFIDLVYFQVYDNNAISFPDLRFWQLGGIY